MSNGKVMIIHLTVGLIKKISLYKVSYFLESYSHNKSKIRVELDLSSYATKSDLQKVTSVNTSKFTKKVDLANLKSDVNDLVIDNLKTVPVDLSKLSNLVKNDVFKRTLNDELVKNVIVIQTIDTSDLVKKGWQRHKYWK